eukprot:gb/GECG01012239.1/.p1 GENE.gb/GECG01012239.1/~~gb/GECG01012239.1/.p1  ORF type:complete len:327 (+),score=47.99 gb/GECG01012239.1/:1-981(+)
MPPKKKSNKQEEDEEEQRRAEVEQEIQQQVQAANEREQPDIESFGFNSKLKSSISDAFRECSSYSDGTVTVDSVAGICQQLGLKVRPNDAQSDDEGVDIFGENDLLSSLRDNNESRITEAEFFGVYHQTARPNRSYGQALREAAGRGEIQTVKDFIYRGCDPGGIDGKGWTAVHYSAEFGRTETITVMQKLCGIGVLDIDAPDNMGWTPLMIACNTGKAKTVSWLLGAGADPEAENDHKRTPLHMASAEGFVECIQCLVSYNVNMDPQDDAGFTPLHLAGLHGHDHAVRVLLENGAQSSVQDILKHTPDYWAHKDVQRAFPSSLSK